MELENTNFESINFARATYPDKLAVFTIGSTLIDHIEGVITDSAVEDIESSIDDYARDNSRLNLPIQSETLPGIFPLEIEPVSEEESEVLRKLIPNWRQVGSFLIRLDSIKLPSIAPANTERPSLLSTFI
jgi:hypothetical protein